MKKNYFLFVVLLYAYFPIFSQEGFQYLSSKKKIVIPCQISNNLVILPIKMNGVSLNFLLDTGVENTILFSLEEADSVQFKKVEKIKIRGLGSGESINAYRSENNKVEIGEYIDKNHEIYIILDQEINFSAQLGIPVHGILGYQFFNNNLIEINHIAKKVLVHRSKEDFSLNKLKKYTEIPISIELEKPYVKSKVILNNIEKEVKLLIDTGGSDAIWLFEDGKEINCPLLFFEDFLGRGFSGDIFGKRSRIQSFTIGSLTLDNPTTSFPNLSSLKGATLVEGRKGSIGSGIIKRFNVLFDYRNSKMYLKKNKEFGAPFNYNMSGMEVQHNGKELVQEEVELKTNLVDKETRNSMIFLFEAPIKYKFTLKPIFEISNIRPNSPADLAGLKKGDILKKINNTNVYKYKLQDIIALLQSEEDKWISVEYDRKGKIIRTEFQLKKIL
ncbi:MAG: aspartyl protease family protein [Bacteroidota bacterium]